MDWDTLGAFLTDSTTLTIISVYLVGVVLPVTIALLTKKDLTKKAKTILRLIAIVFLLITIGILCIHNNNFTEQRSIASEFDDDGNTPDQENVLISETPNTTENYDSLVSKAILECEKLKAHGEYQAALQVLKNAIERVGNVEQLDDAYIECENLYYNSVIKATLDESSDYQSKEEFILALSVLRNAISTIGEDAALTSEIAKCEKNYVEYIDTLVEESISNEEWDKAKAIIDEAVRNLPQNSRLLTIQKNVVDSMPIRLYDTNVLYDGKVYWRVTKEDDKTFTIGSQSFNVGFLLGCDHSLFGEGDGFALFDLQGKYDAISFDVGKTNEYEMQDVKLHIYLEGELVEEYDLSAEQPLQSMVIQLNGASNMKIQITGGSRVMYGFVNVLLYPHK